jgi:hypothetical protein
MRLLAFITAAACMFVLALPAVADISDAEIRRILIQRSIATYSGNCPCPYKRDVADRTCGRRSAYSKPGGESPLCYPTDVTDEMVARIRRSRS